MWRTLPGYWTDAIRGRKAEYTQQQVRESADPIEVLYGSCNVKSSGISLLTVACVSHELHARKILDE